MTDRRPEEKKVVIDFKRLEIVPEEFYNRDTLLVARELLGKYLVRRYTPPGKKPLTLAVKIVETEGYHMNGDDSCHAARGKTKRNEVMFGPPGRLYVYFTYGMHYCMNIVTEAEGVAAAVLLRAGEPVTGSETMQNLRGEKITHKLLAAGPARLCQALSITTEQNGITLDRPPLYIARDPQGPAIEKDQIIETTRIGISQAVDHPWRFYIKDNVFVSRR